MGLLTSRKPSGVGRLRGTSWRPFEPLSDVVEPLPDTRTLDHQSLVWDRRRQPEHAGIIHASKAHLIATPGRRPRQEDPCAREVYPLSRLGTLIRYSHKKRFWTKALRGRMKKVSPVPEIRLGQCLVLGAFYNDCNNYYHFWADAIADVWFARQAGVDTDGVPHILMPYSGARWQREILDLCGIDPGRVVPLSSYGHFYCRELLLPLRAKGSFASPPWLVRALREQSGYEFPAERKRRIYVSRLDADKRRLVNEQDVIDLVRGLGFEVITGSEYSVAEQQRVFGEASVVVAPHGAALTNLAWCAPGTRVLEFVPEEHNNPCFFDLARASGLDYNLMLSRRCPSGRDEYELDLNPLRVFLQSLDVAPAATSPQVAEL